MNLSKRIDAFVKLGEYFSSEPDDNLQNVIYAAQHKNPWFTPANVLQAIGEWGAQLTKDNLDKWTSAYELSPPSQKKVGIIMAGNIPMVGFHDLLSVVLSGHYSIVKMSSQDDVLMRQIIDRLLEYDSDLQSQITIADQLKDIDAVIATGSDNSSRYFEYYFGKYPHIIRKNRTSVAIITGDEGPEDLKALGRDVFSYFGLGCRNVSKLYIPKDYDITQLLDVWKDYGKVLDHHKYRNNYDYHKSILLVNKEKHLDTGFALLRETNELVSPLSVIYYEYYEDDDTVKQYVTKEASEKIQCVVSATASEGTVAPGSSQSPQLWDYADNADTLAFLQSL